jgi:hypothetical protein
LQSRELRELFRTSKTWTHERLPEEEAKQSREDYLSQEREGFGTPGRVRGKAEVVWKRKIVVFSQHWRDSNENFIGQAE